MELYVLVFGEERRVWIDYKVSMYIINFILLFFYFWFVKGVIDLINL